MSGGPPPLRRFEYRPERGLPTRFADKGSSGAAGGVGGTQKWSEAAIKAEWSKTARGKEILKNLPKETTFKAYEKKAGDIRVAHYERATRTIYIPSSYSSKEAAPTAAHEAVHADQHLNHFRPLNQPDVIAMEVEAKHAGLDVWEQMGRPKVPYNHEGEADLRKRDPKAYDDLVREAYKKTYGFK